MRPQPVPEKDVDQAMVSLIGIGDCHRYFRFAAIQSPSAAIALSASACQGGPVAGLVQMYQETYDLPFALAFIAFVTLLVWLFA
jgi:hypothetical protein